VRHDRRNEHINTNPIGIEALRSYVRVPHAVGSVIKLHEDNEQSQSKTMCIFFDCPISLRKICDAWNHIANPHLRTSSTWYVHPKPPLEQQRDTACSHKAYPVLPERSFPIPPEEHPTSHPCCMAVGCEHE